MEFRVLGPLEAWDREFIVDLGALLLVRPGGLVAIERFVDELWPERPPSDARALVRSHESSAGVAVRIARCGSSGDPETWLFAGRTAKPRCGVVPPGPWLGAR